MIMKWIENAWAHLEAPSGTPHHAITQILLLLSRSRKLPKFFDHAKIVKNRPNHASRPKILPYHASRKKLNHAIHAKKYAESRDHAKKYPQSRHHANRWGASSLGLKNKS